jgi:hypothetical protein
MRQDERTMGVMPGESCDELWYVRRGEEIRGPYRWEVIARNVGLGRIHVEDRLSRDQDHWLMPNEVLPRLPMPGALTGSVHDERRTQRRTETGEVPAEQREGQERRALEEPDIVNRRARSERVWAGLRPVASVTSLRLPLLAIGLALSASFALALRLSTPAENVVPDCRATAASGINWDFCAKPGQQLAARNLTGMSARNAQLSGTSLVNANLRGADFAYSDLSTADLTLADARQARLVGASLRHAVLNHARLTGADLSFADLSGASLAGAELSAVRLGNTIWIDGRVCARDSIGVCNAQ